MSWLRDQWSRLLDRFVDLFAGLDDGEADAENGDGEPHPWWEEI